MAAVIEVEGLSKQYRRLRGPRVVALDRLDLTVPEGGVFGFLGPNGSGKTTTIRCLLGLVAPDGGRAQVLGVDVPARLHDVIGAVGSVVENPAFFPSFSGRRNLMLLARLRGIEARRVDAVLERVGLADRADDPVRAYSFGMRQRLGVAAALLADPALLILDEPANGLDPAGIREVRELVRTLGSEGRTVFLSSHILSEVQQTCDRLAILHHGRCIAQGEVSSVLSQGRGVGLVVKVDRLRDALRTLREAGIAAELRHDHLRVDLPPREAARVTETLARHQLWVTELRPEEVALEDVFLELTAEPEDAA